jgi:cytochrome c-type biogenesis protein CcmH/NrfG
MIQHNLEFFWATVGFMAGIAVAFFVIHLWRANERAWAIGAPTLLVLLGFGLYYWVGGSKQLTTAAPATEGAAHATTGDAAPGSLDDAANKLAAKLATGTGSDGEWELLAQTYEFLGDTAAAQLAKQHQLKTGAVNQAAAQTSEDDAAILQRYEQLVTVQPGNASAWRAIAQLQRRARRFAPARQAYEKVIELRAMDADTWADYADVCASMSSLSDAAVSQAIEAALLLDPKHAQALWLKASVAHAENRHAAAVTVWQQLRAVLPNGSPDLAVIDANMVEDTRLSGSTVTQPAAAQSVAQVQGTVELDAAMQAQVTPDMTLFIYAKADDSPAPVAAYRSKVGSWPVKFVLDDSNAMMPARKLSLYPQVKLEARLSRSGQATASQGDLQADAVTVATRNGPRVTLKISRVRP